MKKNASYKFLIPVGLALLFAIMAMAGITTGLEFRVMDALMGFRAAPPEDPRIVLVDIDDQAIEAVGSWPFSRSITADGLMLMAEMGAKQATFDIEYTEKSPRGVNADILEIEIPQLLDAELGRLQSSIRDLFEAVSKGQISVREAGGYIDDLVGIAGQTKASLKEAIDRIALDNDRYLAGAARFFGDAYFTVNMRAREGDKVDPGIQKLAVERHALKRVKLESSDLRPVINVIPAIPPLLETARGIGFTNAEADEDGIRRRVALVQRFGDAWFGQLVFRPLLDVLGDPEVTVQRREIVLKAAKTRDGSTRDIRIPISPVDGKALIDWPHKTFEPSFKHVSFAQLYLHDTLFADLVQNVRVGESWNFFHAYRGDAPLLGMVREWTALREAIMKGDAGRERVAEYAALRAKFLADLGAFLDARPEEAILADVNGLLADPGLPAEERAQLGEFLKTVPDFFEKTRGIHGTIVKYRKNELARLSGAFCVVGQTNTGSTDLGANPFAKAYPNIGTHASLVNMILNGKFMSELSPLWSSLLALIVALGISLLTRTMPPSWSIGIGVAASFGTMAVAAGFFAATGLYLPVIPLAGPVIVSFITVTFVTFFISEKEKGFIRNAFSRYLSADVIKQIIANPDSLKLGGEQKFMTAMFTDIKGFSTISEKLTPSELVHLLNQYLSGMSDRVLEMGGTIDKYEGDAIIAFFGAPLDLPDHAARALKAAVRMKRVEGELNEKFMAEGTAPGPLLTRFGINSGQMVVGNMGTVKKMDYTIIGDSVNLAARLEGVNKRYGSWMCVSEDTVSAAGGGFVFRKLDRIRVVGKAVPIRIFELVEEEGSVPDPTLKAIKRFEEGLEVFETRNWNEAIKVFESVSEFVQNDPPSQRFIKTCREYIASPPPENWDGVYAMDMK